MRLTGTTAFGIRLPIIGNKDNLTEIVAEYVHKTLESEGFGLKETDVIGVTEALVAKSEGNFASIKHIGEDVRRKFGGRPIGLVYPMLSRNRFLNILKGVAAGAEQVYVLLSYPSDEVGNPIMDTDALDRVIDRLQYKMADAKIFRAVTGEFLHPFTHVDYIDLYENAGDNIKVYLSNDPRDILSLSKDILVAEIHSRFKTKKRLLNAGAETVYTLSDILNESVNGSGFNTEYGVLGSNLSTDEVLKLFPNYANRFVHELQAKIREKTGVSPEILVYGDGAFKDPVHGIWELGDPVVSPGFTERLGGLPDEVKLKYIADSVFTDLQGEEKRQAVMDMVKNKGSDAAAGHFREGTTPRKYADLLGSLCDLMGGSGDKGTPVILIRGYFDNFATE